MIAMLAIALVAFGCDHSSLAGSEWRVLLDTGRLTLRVPSEPELAQVDPNRLLTGIFGDRHQDFQATITGYARGAFLQSGAFQEVVVIQFPGPNLLQPGEENTILAIFEGDQVARLTLPDHLGPFIVGTVDGLIGEDLLILAGEQMQMGERVGNISIVSLRAARIESVAEFPQAWQDPCESPLGRAEGQRFVRIEMPVPHSELRPPGEAVSLPNFRAVEYSQPCPRN
ncbi:hypothetical protein NEA10_11045 [Phormidium yuhuli AB48]|uniref:Uncharacterized protein n=1 Tax=Phormidium yuhuli AB48 TaxID=2940671 RepID=A0ABY5AJR5_9CYAN|nr:hypothetical protein [Phormidium yuhuli]USR89429.1 hypothetical protein NEA10_11045 [Phormidium yuhuli AB48]